MVKKYKEISDGKRCKAKNKKGGPCRAFARADGYCYQHSPETETEARVDRSRGGKKRMALLTAGNVLRLDPKTEIKDTADAQRLLSAMITDVFNAQTNARFDVGRKGRTVANLLAVLLKSFDISENEQRFAEGLRKLKEMEARLKVKSN